MEGKGRGGGKGKTRGEEETRKERKGNRGRGKEKRENRGTENTHKKKEKNDNEQGRETDGHSSSSPKASLIPLAPFSCSLAVISTALLSSPSINSLHSPPANSGNRSIASLANAISLSFSFSSTFTLVSSPLTCSSFRIRDRLAASVFCRRLDSIELAKVSGRGSSASGIGMEDRTGVTEAEGVEVEGAEESSVSRELLFFLVGPTCRPSKAAGIRLLLVALGPVYVLSWIGASKPSN